MLGKFATSDIDLAAAAQSPATTDGIDINAKRTGRLKNGGARPCRPEGVNTILISAAVSVIGGAPRQALRRRRVWRRSRPPSPAAAGSRNRLIQLRHSGSCPFITLAPMIPVISSE